jgi:predicted AlkP superfamily pyrophosphatase or phosphodiesterase
MKYFLLSVAFLQCIATATAKQKKPAKQPKLLVGIVIDQMRWDYLYRYQSRYSDGGFKRVMNEGFNCQQTMINYVPTFTAPGHACVSWYSSE